MMTVILVRMMTAPQEWVLSVV
eukprot:COSAG01_NODE_50567_length_362_cov_0.817490_1_plen_21_part_10